MGLPSWFIYYQVGVFGVLLTVLFVWVYREKVRIVFRARFYREGRDGLYHCVGKKDFNPKDESIEFKVKDVKKKFEINLKNVSEIEKNKTFLSFDVDTQKALRFKVGRDVGDGLLNELVLGGKLMQQFVDKAMGLSPVMLVILGVMVGVAVLCFVVGLFVSPYLLPVEAVGGGVPVA